MKTRLLTPIIATALVLLVPTIAGAATQTLHSWGQYENDSATPLVVTGVPGTITNLYGINSAGYARTDSGQVWAWGKNADGQLGNGTESDSDTTAAVQVQFPPGVVIKQLASEGPRDTEIAIDANGNAWGWGQNDYDQLCLPGDPYPTQLTTPVELPLTNPVTLSAGAGDHASYYADGVLYSCGFNNYGQLGTGNGNNAASPQPVVGLPNLAVTAITAGWSIEGVTLSDGSFWNWGYNIQGQLGNRSSANSAFPVQVTLPAAVSEVSEGGSGTNVPGQTVALLSDGTIWAWGDNARGQFCSTPKTVNEHPKQIAPPAGVAWTHVWTGGAASYFIDNTGQLWDCGDNSKGELGIGTSGGFQPTPQMVLKGITITVVTSTSHTVSALS
jgi:alpha-tubulin suppressor-like RCC1 family protein